MNIGTPLSDSATRAMLLGAGELGKEIIIALQRLGVETLAVDRYDNAPGHQVAHHAYTIDMTDGPALRALIEAKKPMLVVPEIEAIATDMLTEIERDGIAEAIPTARATQLTMNREGIRRLAAEELELPTSRYAFVDSLNQLQMAIDSGVGYPCIVKPVMSSSGKGQSTIHDPADVQAAWDYAMSGGRVSGARVIVEEQIDFDDEITLLTVRALDSDGEIQTHFCEPIGHRQEQGDYVESWQPQSMSATALTRARNITKKVTDSLGLPVDTGLREPGASAVIYGGQEASGIHFNNITEVLRVPGSDLRLFGKPESFPRRRMGVALARGKNIEQARERARQTAAWISPGK